MSNGNLIKELKRVNKVNNNISSNSLKKKKASNEKERLQNSISDINEIAERASSANPFLPKKDIKYWLTDEGLLYIQSWANDGLTNQELAMKMNIGETTLYRWCNTDERIRAAIIRGRDTMTMDVENMLYKCAMGFKYTEQQVTKDGDIVEVERFYQPSAEAQKFILTNRRKDKWKSKQEVALEAQATVQATVSQADSLAEELFGGDDTETIEETKELSNV